MRTTDPLKTFIARNVSLKDVDNDCVGGRDFNRHNQGDILVKAKIKAAASEVLKSLGYTIDPSLIRIGRGTDVQALNAAGVITDDAIIITPANRPLLVAKARIDENGERNASTVGELVTDPETYKPVFLPVSE